MLFEDGLDKCDVFVCGTGLTECIIAAACARIGKTVVHIDENDYYGNQWASFSFDQLRNWIADKQKANTGDTLDGAREVGDGDNLDWSNRFEAITNVEEECYVAECDLPESAEQQEWTLDKLKKNSRKFNLDLVPRVRTGQRVVRVQLIHT